MDGVGSGSLGKTLIGNDVGAPILPAFILSEKKNLSCWSEVCSRRGKKQQRESRLEVGC